MVTLARSESATSRTVLLSSIALVVAFALGVLTAYAQAWLPDQLGSLANSTGSWALIACSLSLLAGSAGLAAVLGSGSLLALLAGYVVGAQTRGDASSTATITFWAAAALLCGPLLGLAAHWVKTLRDQRAALGLSAISGLLLGEGVYGLLYIADTTYPPYWWAEILIGLVLLVAFTVGGRLGVRDAALAVTGTALFAAAFVVIYSRNLIAVLP